MSITTQLNEREATITINIQGRFDFNLHQQFRDIIEKIDDRVQYYVVDLKDSDYMDSAALGMLLLLLEKAGNEKERVRLTNPNQTIQKILEIANFHILFEIV
ncbi:MAG: STAS domain-containing protein [Methylococcaceae bacterium]